MLKGTTNEERIWNYLTGKGLSKAGAAGLMGNLYAESGLIPTNLQNTYERKLGFTDASYTVAVDNGSYTNFVYDSAGYGLAQWTYWSRKQNMLEFARAAGKSIGDLETQLDFLFKELSEGYKSVLDTLKTTTSVKAASDSVLLNFERPADQSDTVKTRRAGYGQTYYDKYAAVKKEEAIMPTKITTGKQLAERAIDVAKNYKTLYVMGCFGAPLTAANKQRYTQNHSYNKAADRTRMINAASEDTFGFDCVCLIKGLLWGWCGDKSKNYGGADYAVNGVPDIGADTMITKCLNVTTDFSRIEVGEAVWTNGHIGIYVGNGLSVECTPSWANKVQLTACNCAMSGYPTRTWKKHGKLPYISYTGASEAPTPTPAATPAQTGGAYKVGDIVDFTGSKHYTNANAASGPSCKPGKAKVTNLYPSGKHPYHLVAEKGGGSTVYGWVDAVDIGKAMSTATKSVEQLAREVIAGKWGNGADRKSRLQAAGYDYAAVQCRVNELMK